MDPIFVATIAALPVGMIAFELFRASRSSRRNHEDRCGNCGGPLYGLGLVASPSLVQGHLVCEPCAAKARRGLTKSLIAAISITGTTVLALAAVAVWAPQQLGSHPWLPAAATALTYPPIFAGALAWMKRANRRAAQRLGLQAQASLSASNDPTLAGTARGIGTLYHARTPNER